MNKIILILWTSLIIASSSIYAADSTTLQRTALVQTSDWILKQAFLNKKNGLQVQGQGSVIRLLSDDLTDSRHQRFILRLNSNQTLLMAHNIDIAPRLNGLKIGDVVAFYGQYEWDSKGGLIHWTHHDPAKKHINGWLKYKNKLYQ